MYAFVSQAAVLVSSRKKKVPQKNLGLYKYMRKRLEEMSKKKIIIFWWGWCWEKNLGWLVWWYKEMDILKSYHCSIDLRGEGGRNGLGADNARLHCSCCSPPP